MDRRRSNDNLVRRERRPVTPLRQGLRLLAMGLILLVGWGASVYLTGSPDRISIQVGDPAPRSIKAARTLVYVSEIKTEEARSAAVARVGDVYSPADLGIALTQIRLLETTLGELDAIRNTPAVDEARKARLVREIPGLQLDQDEVLTILEADEENWQWLSVEAVRLLDQIMREELREGQVNVTAQQVQRLARRILSPAQRDVLLGLMGVYVVPNSFLDIEQTAANRQAARKAVEPIQWTIRAGESVVREGDIVSPFSYEKLQVLGLLDDGLRWQEVAGTLLFMLTLVASLGAYVVRAQSILLTRPRRQLLLMLVMLIMGVGAQLSLPGRVLVPYLFPAAAFGMLVAALLNLELGIVISAITAVLVGIGAGGSIELTVYALAGGIVGSVAVSRVDQVSAFLWSAVFVAATNTAVVLAFQLRSPIYDALGLLQLLGMAVGNGVLSACLTLVVFALIGRFFGITTFMQLLELAHPTHPLFQQLLIKAPGTYHHSIIISNMAERAAQSIGADPLLVRVGSYYHDIGKITRPYFFAENQSDGANPHDRLEPKTSAEIIISHVVDGMALAKRYRLPDRVADFIPEHHGTTFASFFYHQACNQNGGEPLSEDAFRYPGPRPQSKETAIVMLADSIEAAVRAKRPATQGDTRQLINKIIADRLLSGQIDESDLTLQDLDRIRSAFASVLQGVFHPRIDYPMSIASQPEPPRISEGPVSPVAKTDPESPV